MKTLACEQLDAASEVLLSWRKHPGITALQTLPFSDPERSLCRIRFRNSITRKQLVVHVVKREGETIGVD